MPPVPSDDHPFGLFLLRQVTVDDVEADSPGLVYDRAHGGEPASAIQDEWQRLKKSVREGDVLWTYTDAPDGVGCYEEGLVLLRGDDVVCRIVTVHTFGCF